MKPWLVMLILLAAAALAAAADISCVSCHDTWQEQLAPSAHGQAGLTCVDCHGGDPGAADETAHATDNFQRPGDKRAIAEFCASCHSDVRRMNPYGLPTDQLARYRTSKHGEQLYGQNDQQVATCTDCHGVHDILGAESPDSRVHPAQIPATCGRCHADEKLMSQYKLPANVVDQYRTSYHAHLLFEKGDLSAPNCVTCHGNHGATPPGTVEVGQVCGKCHNRQRELFEQSPHAAAAKAGAFGECVSCHGNHAIQKASIRVFDQTCVQCHAQDTKPLQVRDVLIKTIQTAKGAYLRASDRVRDAQLRGLSVDDEQLLLQEANTQVTQLEALQHTLAPEQVQPSAVRTEEIVADALRGVQRLEQVEVWKQRALVPIWGFLGIMAFLFWAKLQRIERKRDQ